MQLQLGSGFTGHEQLAQRKTSLAPIRLRVLLGFWITALIPGLGGGLGRVVLWGSIFFASILVHELAHALVGLCFGHRARIVLHPLGGLTEFEPLLSRGRAVLALLAGPALSLAAGLILAFLRRGSASPTLAFAMWANLAWGTMNLLPILPFDGGRALVVCFGRRKESAAIISMAVAFAAATLGMTVFRSIGVTLFFWGAAILSAFEWAKLRDQSVRAQALNQLTAARLLLQRERYREARRIAESIAKQARDPESRNAALTTLAWAWLGESEPRRAREALAHIRPASAVDGYVVAAIENVEGHPDRAIATLERQRRETTLSREAARLLVDLHVQAADLQRAAEVACELADVLGPDDLRRITEAFEHAGDHRHATALAEAAQVSMTLQPNHG